MEQLGTSYAAPVAATEVAEIADRLARTFLQKARARGVDLVSEGLEEDFRLGFADAWARRFPGEVVPAGFAALVWARVLAGSVH